MKHLLADNTVTTYHVILSKKGTLESQTIDFNFYSEAKEAMNRLEFFLHPYIEVDLFQRTEKAHFDEEGEFTHLELIHQKDLSNGVRGEL